MELKLIAGSLGVFVLLLALPGWRPAAAQGMAPGPGQPPRRLGSAGRAELEAFLDSAITAQMEAMHIPGATVAVVQDGEILVAKGYGYADLSGRPVQADETLFRIASISKLFTWTAVMQLAEAGKLDLDADINIYLKGFQIPNTYPEPITLRHLMAHAAGFETRSGNWAHSAADLQPLGVYLAGNMPARVRPPGEVSAYSNYGAALAGYIVECVSGMPYEQYVAENIFKPLGMQHSTCAQPAPVGLAADLAVGYTYARGTYRPVDFEYLQTRPASALSATAADMARFMIAHLQNGRYGEARILQEATARQMHSRLFTHDPRVCGMTYGFMEKERNGQRILEHGGSIIAFQSQLALLPERNVGLFVAYNSDTATAAPEALLREFLDRYYPAPPAPQPEAPGLKDLGRFVGHYGLSLQIPSTTFDKLGVLFMGNRVTASQEGFLLTRGLGGPQRWVEVEPLVFREAGGQDILVFRTDSRGRVTHMFPGNGASMGYVKLPWYACPEFQVPLLVALAALFLSSLALRPWGQGGVMGLARWLAVAVSGLNILFLIGLAAALSDMRSIVYYGLTPLLRVVLLVPWLSLALAAGVLMCMALGWIRGYGTVAGRVHYTLLSLAALVFLWQLRFWNLLRIDIF